MGRRRRQESSDETAPDDIPPQQLSKATAPTTKVHLRPALEGAPRTVLREVVLQQGETSEDYAGIIQRWSTIVDHYSLIEANSNNLC